MGRGKKNWPGDQQGHKKKKNPNQKSRNENSTTVKTGFILNIYPESNRVDIACPQEKIIIATYEPQLHLTLQTAFVCRMKAFAQLPPLSLAPDEIPPEHLLEFTLKDEREPKLRKLMTKVLKVEKPKKTVNLSQFIPTRVSAVFIQDGKILAQKSGDECAWIGYPFFQVFSPDFGSIDWSLSPLKLKVIVSTDESKFQSLRCIIEIIRDSGMDTTLLSNWLGQISEFDNNGWLVKVLRSMTKYHVLKRLMGQKKKLTKDDVQLVSELEFQVEWEDQNQTRTLQIPQTSQTPQTLHIPQIQKAREILSFFRGSSPTEQTPWGHCDPFFIQRFLKKGSNFWGDLIIQARQELGNDHPLAHGISQNLTQPGFVDLVVPDLPPSVVRVYLIQHDEIEETKIMDFTSLPLSLDGTDWIQVSKEIFEHTALYPYLQPVGHAPEDKNEVSNLTNTNEGDFKRLHISTKSQMLQPYTQRGPNIPRQGAGRVTRGGERGYSYRVPTVSVVSVPQDQDSYTCYAEAASAVFRAAIDRVQHRSPPYPSRAEIKSTIIHDFSSLPSSFEPLLDRYCQGYRLQWKAISRDEAANNLMKGIYVLVSFSLPSTAAWNAFSIRANERKAITSELFPDFETKDEGCCAHGVIFVNYTPENQEFLAQNSKGTEWGDNGCFRIKIDDDHFATQLCMKFFLVYWTEEDLTPEEKEKYQSYRESVTGRSSTDPDINQARNAPGQAAPRLPSPNNENKRCPRCAEICSDGDCVPCANSTRECQGCSRSVRSIDQRDFLFLKRGYCWSCLKKIDQDPHPNYHWEFPDTRGKYAIYSWRNIQIDEQTWTQMVPFIGPASAKLLAANRISTVYQLFDLLGLREHQPPKDSPKFYDLLALLRRYVPRNCSAELVLHLLCYKAYRLKHTNTTTTN